MQRGEKNTVSPKVKHQKSSSLRFQENSVYRSFFGEKADEDVSSEVPNLQKIPCKRQGKSTNQRSSHLLTIHRMQLFDVMPFLEACSNSEFVALFFEFSVNRKRKL